MLNIMQTAISCQKQYTRSFSAEIYNKYEWICQAYKDSVERHNAQVQKNRETLSKIINCLKCCGFDELSLRGHDESEGSSNQRIFMGLLNYTN